MQPRPTHIVFDFFGTLVEYSPSRTEQGYERSHALLRDAGSTLAYDEFLAHWSEISARHDAAAERTLREFSMAEVATDFLRDAVPTPSEALMHDFVRTYLSEWNKGVRYPDGVADLLRRLARHFTLAVVTNTHQHDLVPDHLERMGVAHLMHDVITSVEFGQRKPAPEIFRHALRVLGVAAERCLYVGDSYDADYCGARNAGIRAVLIDPTASAPIDGAARLESLFALEQRLRSEGSLAERERE